MGPDKPGNRERAMKKLLGNFGRISDLANSTDGKGTIAAKAAFRKWALASEVVKVASALLIAVPNLLIAQPEPAHRSETSAAQKAPFTIAIRATRSTIKPGSPISVDVTVLNISTHPIEVQLPGPKNPDAFEVHDSDGRLFAPFARAVEVGQGTFVNVESPNLEPGSTSSAIVEPGRSVTVVEALPDIFKLRRPGKYSIIAHRADGLGGFGSVASNRTTVTVMP
jgi:hypothetical protein